MRYELKRDLFSEVDPCFYHLDRKEKERLREDPGYERYRGIYRKKFDAGFVLSSLPPPSTARPPQCHSHFDGVRAMLCDPLLVTLLQCLLNDIVKRNRTRTSDTLTAKVRRYRAAAGGGTLLLPLPPTTPTH